MDVIGNGLGNMSQILDDSVYILHSTNTIRKGMNPIILPLAMGK